MGLFDFLSGKLTKKKFARIYAEALEKAGATVVEIDDADFKIHYKLGEIEPATAFLDNAFSDYSNAEAQQRDSVLQAYILSSASMNNVPDDFEDAKPDIRTVVRSKAFLESAKLANEINGGDAVVDLASHVISNHLCATLVLDFPHAMASVSNSQLNDWDVSYYEALEVGIQNLVETSVGYSQIGDGFYSMMTNDSYDASRLLAIDMIRSMEVAGQHVALVPHRDSLMIAGSEDEISLEIMCKLAEETMHEDRPVSAIPVILTDDGWEDWDIPKEHRLEPLFRKLRIQSLAPLYEEQKATLERLHENTSLDIFVASYMVMQKQETEELTSLAALTLELDSVFPETDEIAFFDPKDESVVRVSWEDAVRILGDKIEDTEHYPPRFRFRGEVSESQLDQLKNAEG